MKSWKIFFTKIPEFNASLMLSVPDTDWIRIQSSQWFRIRIPECSLLRTEGFFCSMDVLYRGLGISKLQFLIKKILNIFQP
jgi:hypothetical protein